MLYTLEDRQPQLLGQGQYVAEGARVIGSVRLHDDVSVWFNAVVRADNDTISIGARSNIQDGAVLHTDPGFPMSIGENVTIGHQAMLHGCNIGDGSLVGMGAVILNGACIGREVLIAAHALVPEGMQIPDGVLVVGVPGKIVRQLSAEERLRLAWSAQVYVDKITRYREGLRPVMA